jgi:hypothetical protein
MLEALPSLRGQDDSTTSPPGMVLDCHLRVDVSGAGTFKARGHVFLSNVRILFVASKPSMQGGLTFFSFDIPLRGITESQFNQPIFGANNL